VNITLSRKILIPLLAVLIVLAGVATYAQVRKNGKEAALQAKQAEQMRQCHDASQEYVNAQVLQGKTNIDPSGTYTACLNTLK
jgi:hypothetical protein